MTGADPRLSSLTDGQRTAVRQMLDHAVGDARSERMTIAFMPNRKAEAVWLTAFGRARGLEVNLVGVSSAATRERAVQEQSVGLAPPVVVLADAQLSLPPTAVQVAGTEDASPFDLWLDPAAVARAERQLVDRLSGRNYCVQTSASVVTGLASSVQPGPIRGTVDVVPLTGDGAFVADACVTVNRTVRWDGRLTGVPMTLRLADRRIVEVGGASTDVTRFVRRAVAVHHVNWLRLIRFGVRPVTAAWTSAPSLVNATREGVSIILGVPENEAYLGASADVEIVLTANLEEVVSGEAARQSVSRAESVHLL